MLLGSNDGRSKKRRRGSQKDLKNLSQGCPSGCQREGDPQAVVCKQYHGQGVVQMVNRTAARTLVASPTRGIVPGPLAAGAVAPTTHADIHSLRATRGGDGLW